MAAKKGGLGKGISQLFVENAPEDILTGSTVTLPISDVEPDRSQPRAFFEETALRELSESILAHGILQPLLVRPRSDGSYQIVAGERRWRAARMAGLTEVPVVIKVLDDSEAAAIALIENLQREDLNAMEEAAGIRRLMDDFGFTQEQAAEKLSKSRPALANALRLLQLPAETAALVREGTLSAGHARTLLGLSDPASIAALAKTVTEKKLSVRETEKMVKALNRPAKAPAAPAKRSVFTDEAELALSRMLGRKVKLTEGKKGGKIEFEYYDEDDLKKLAKLFEE